MNYLLRASPKTRSLFQHRYFARTISPSELVGPVDSCGDRLHLSRAITLIESSRPSHRAEARAVLQEALALAPPARLTSSFRIGVSGPPGAEIRDKLLRLSSFSCTSSGVGKSSFIERLGMHLVSKRNKVHLPTSYQLFPCAQLHLRATAAQRSIRN
jgi:hypothetical protein